MAALLEHFEEVQDESTLVLETQLYKVVELLKKVSPETEIPPAASSFSPDDQILGSPFVLPESAGHEDVKSEISPAKAMKENKKS